MHMTSVFLVRTDKRDVYVNEYVMRKTVEGQLVLDLVARKGSIYDIKHTNTKGAFLAIMKKQYREPKKSVVVRVGEVFEEVVQTESVVVTLHDKDAEVFEPYQIMIFYNNIEIERLSNSENPEPKENEIILQITGKRKKLFVMRRTPESTIPNMERVYEERYRIYSDVQSVEWIDEDTYLKIGGTYIFSEEWAMEMLGKLQYVKSSEVVYPTLDGEWISRPIDSKKRALPRVVYKDVLRGTRATKGFWEWFLAKFQKIEVEYTENVPEGKVIKHLV